MSATVQPIRPVQLRLWNDREISVATTARILNASPDTVRRLIEAGAIRAYRIRATGWYRVSYDSVAEYLHELRGLYGIDYK